MTPPTDGLLARISWHSVIFRRESEFDSITCTTVGVVLFLRWVLILFDEKWYEGVIVGHVPRNPKVKRLDFMKNNGTMGTFLLGLGLLVLISLPTYGADER